MKYEVEKSDYQPRNETGEALTTIRCHFDFRLHSVFDRGLVYFDEDHDINPETRSSGPELSDGKELLP